MLIEITHGTSEGTWNLVAKAKADAWPPMYMAYDRSPWAIKALVHGILQDSGVVEPAAVPLPGVDAEVQP